MPLSSSFLPLVYFRVGLAHHIFLFPFLLHVGCPVSPHRDNVDKNVRPTFQRSNHHTQSLHHFHSYAVKDRVNLSGSSEEGKSPSSVDPSSLIVTKEEWDCFKDDCSILIAR